MYGEHAWRSGMDREGIMEGFGTGGRVAWEMC